MPTTLEVPDQMDLFCDFCGARSVKLLIHRLTISGPNKKVTYLLCDTCVVGLKNATWEY